jgi:four helix bundle protein
VQITGKPIKQEVMLTFINKIKICESEANETVYWFDILSNLEFIENDQINALKKEAKEILAIFASKIITMKKKY